MGKRVIVHHAHHADEGDDGIYRLIHAECVEAIVHDYVEEPPTTEVIQVANPDYDVTAEDFDGDTPMTIDVEREVPGEWRLVERVELVYVDHQEIVWDAGDPKWKDRDSEDIAAEQRGIVRDAITKRIAEAERQSVEREAARTDLGGIGSEL